MTNAIPTHVSFTYVVLEGSPYEVGVQQGEELKADKSRSPYLTPVLPFLDGYSAADADIALAYIEKYCPGLREEIQGAADTFGIPVQEIAFIGGKNKENGSSVIPLTKSTPNSHDSAQGSHCSQLVVLPSATENGHLYAAQNTDCGLTDLDLRLCLTRVAGKPAHIGFSDMIFGRGGGINEHGLCVTTSWGAPMMWPNCHGLPYFAVVRALLDRCRNVDEAVETLASIPVAWCTNFILSDSSGKAALVEVAGEDRGMKRIGNGFSTPFLFATNHFTLPELHAFSQHPRLESIKRRETIEARIGAAVPKVTKEGIRDLVSEPVPDGVCLQHYSIGLGTLWSMIYDITDMRVDVCFGAPCSEENPWHSFGFDDPVGKTECKAHVPDKAASPAFWETL